MLYPTCLLHRFTLFDSHPLWSPIQQLMPMMKPYQHQTGHQNILMPIAQYLPYLALPTHSLDFPWLSIDCALPKQLNHPLDGLHAIHLFLTPLLHPTRPSCNPPNNTQWLAYKHGIPPLPIPAATISTYKTTPWLYATCHLHASYHIPAIFPSCPAPSWQTWPETTLAHHHHMQSLCLNSTQESFHSSSIYVCVSPSKCESLSSCPAAG